MNTIEEKRLAAEQSRIENRQLRMKRAAASRATRAGLLPVPVIVGVMDAVDGTLEAEIAKSGNPLAVHLNTPWEGAPVYAGDENTIYFDIAYEGGEFKEVFSVVIDETKTFPITDLTIPVEAFAAEGSYKFRYRAALTNGLTDSSPDVPLRLDRIAPYGLATPPDPLKMILPSEPINDAYLASNSDEVMGKIPAYPDWKEGDKVAYYWSKFQSPEQIELIDPVGYVEVTQPPFDVTFDGDTIRSVGDGGCYVLYLLFDKAGNRSGLSFAVSMAVALGDYPVTFQPPVVPAASDGLVDLKDVIEEAGVNVEIPAFDNVKSTDFIELTWGKSVIPAEAIGSVPFPRIMKILPALLKEEYASAVGSVTTNVSYRVLRGTVEMGSEGTSVDVDFSVVGPENPDPWPEPVNPLLLPPMILGTGTNPETNKLNREDKGLPAKLTFKFPEKLIKDDEVNFYWGADIVAASKYVVKGDEVVDTDITVDIPWANILDAGNNPDLKVHFRVRGQDSTNEQHSKPQSVSVDAIEIIPDAPTFLGLTGNYLNCKSLYEDPANPNPLEPAVRVQVPDLSKWLVAGDTVTMKWVALPTRDPAETTPIPGATLEESVVLDATTVNGFVWYVQPYVTYILPTYDPTGPGTNSGRGVVSYQFSYKGEDIFSATDEKYVGMFDGSGSCPLLPAPAP